MHYVDIENEGPQIKLKHNLKVHFDLTGLIIHIMGFVIGMDLVGSE